MPNCNELDLIERAKKGDWIAFEALYKMHQATIFRTALAITNDQAVAEEILQDTFFRAFKHLEKIREGVSLAPWLYRIAVNLAYDWSAKNKRWFNSLGNIIERFSLNVPHPSPEYAVVAQETQTLVHEAINRLEIKQRTVLVLFYLEDCSLAEIAEIVDSPIGTVKSRLHYARENLRRVLLADERLPGGLIYEFT